MVSSTNFTARIDQGGGSSVTVTNPVKFNVRKEEQTKDIVVQDAKIKFQKIKESDKYKVSGDWKDEYVVKIIQETSPEEIEKNQELLNRYKLITFKIPTKKEIVYLKSCYKISNIESPQRYMGAGTKALQSVLDRSLSDNDTQGRLIVMAEITDGKTSPAGFFYKLGFRFIDKSMNEVMDEWLKKNIKIDAPQLTGMMYLPKNNINKLMMYNKNLL